MRLTGLAVERRVAASVIALALVVLGVYGFWHLPVNFLPEVTYPLVRVDVRWPGATPDEVVTNLADPIERQIATVDGLDYLSSESREGRYQLEVNFHYGVDVDVAYQDVLAAMSRAQPNLPTGIDAPIVFKADPSQLPVVQLPISSEQWGLVELRTWTEQWLQDQIIAVAGVGGTEVVGGLKREIRVHVDPGALQKHEVSLSTLLRRIDEENLQQFAGRVTVGPRELLARTDGEYRSVAELSELVLRDQDQARVHLSDVAEIQDLFEPARIVTRYNGLDGVRLSVNKQADANTVRVVQAVKQRMAELGPSLPDHLRIGYMEDQAEYVEAALAGVRNVVVMAAVLVILVVYLFLGSFRQVLVMVLVLPIVLIVNFALMRVAGFSLNIFSLGGLVVAVGVVLDNATVVLENITRLRQARPDDSTAAIAVDATRQVGPAIVAATLSYMALFAPFLLVPGLASLLLRELILVVAGVVGLSLLVAVTLVPMLAAWLIRAPTTGRGPSRFQRIFARITTWYGRALTCLLEGHWRLWPRRGGTDTRWRVPLSAVVVLGFIAVTLGSVAMLPRLGTEFLPQMDDGRIRIDVRMPTGTAVDRTGQVVRQIEQALSDDPLIESIFTLSGGRSRGLFTTEVAYEGELNVQLVPQSRRATTTVEHTQRMRRQLGELEPPGAAIRVRQASTRGIRAGAGGGADIALKIQGPELATLFDLARQVEELLRRSPELTEVRVDVDMDRPEYQVHVDRTRAAAMGMSVRDIAQSLQTLVGGSIATRYKEHDEHYDVRVIVAEHALGSQQALAGLLLDRPGGGHVRLHEIADVRQATGSVQIDRENQVPQVMVLANASGVSVGQAQTALEDAVAGIDLPAGYRFDHGGQVELMRDMQRTMGLIIAFALFFAFVVLAVQFNRLQLPALILITLPACIAGMAAALYLTDLAIGATVVIGLLVVVAATVNDGVLLLNFAEAIRSEKGLGPIPAVVEAAGIRLRPRLMTSVSVIAGLIPLALNLGAGGEMLQPLAVAAIGGLVMEILVALLLMPALYVLFSSRDAMAQRYTP